MTTPAWLLRTPISEVYAPPSHAQTRPGGTFPITHTFKARLPKGTWQEIGGLSSHVAEQFIYAPKACALLEALKACTDFSNDCDWQLSL